MKDDFHNKVLPRRLLFMCVQNSARSQLAEAIARHLAPQGVEVFSAGSQPTSVRPEVLQVLEEKGISTQGLRSKSVEDIDADAIDMVVTLCKKEVCPVFPRPIRRLHWGLPDPAKIENPRKRLEAFRALRDDLIDRIELLLHV